MHRNYISHCQL
nr:unnamed protein product [Callosobruchus analis]